MLLPRHLSLLSNLCTDVAVPSLHLYRLAPRIRSNSVAARAHLHIWQFATGPATAASDFIRWRVSDREGTASTEAAASHLQAQGAHTSDAHLGIAFGVLCMNTLHSNRSWPSGLSVLFAKPGRRGGGGGSQGRQQTRVDVAFTRFRLQLGWLAFSVPLGWANPTVRPPDATARPRPARPPPAAPRSAQPDQKPLCTVSCPTSLALLPPIRRGCHFRRTLRACGPAASLAVHRQEAAFRAGGLHCSLMFAKPERSS